MNILVAGGAGYVGSHMVRYLQKQNKESGSKNKIIVLDSLVTGNAEAIPGVELVVCDIADDQKVEQVMRDHKVDLVMHFAASSLVRESVKSPEKYYQNNVYGSLCLFKAMLRAGVKKIVFSSTCAVYGIPQKDRIEESTPIAPINPYGFSKYVVESMLEDFCKAHNFGAICLRYFNAAGASPDGGIGEDHDPETHLIPLVLQVALQQREKIQVFGDDWPTVDGTCIRDFVHVDDLADAHFRAMKLIVPGVKKAVNLGSGFGFSVNQVVEACRKVTGHPIPSAACARREGDPAILVADNSFAKEFLGWEPRYIDIESIIATAWNWHRSHPDGFSG